MNLFKRKPKEETVSRAEHDIAVGTWRDNYFVQFGEAERLRTELQQERETVGRLFKQVQELKPDALAHRARLKRDREYHANRRQARDKQQAGEVVA